MNPSNMKNEGPLRQATSIARKLKVLIYETVVPVFEREIVNHPRLFYLSASNTVELSSRKKQGQGGGEKCEFRGSFLRILRIPNSPPI